MKICIIGAGAMGGLYGGRLLLAGEDVQFIEIRQAAVDALNNGRFLFDGIDGEHRLKAPAARLLFSLTHAAAPWPPPPMAEWSTCCRRRPTLWSWAWPSFTAVGVAVRPVNVTFLTASMFCGA